MIEYIYVHLLHTKTATLKRVSDGAEIALEG